MKPQLPSNSTFNTLPFLIFIFCEIILFSCERSSKTERSSITTTKENEIVFNLDNELDSIEVLIDSLSIIPLTGLSNIDMILSDQIQLIEKENGYFIFDRVNKQVFKFDLNGNLQNLVGAKGKGPGEYVFPRGICETDNGIFVIDANTRKNLIYSNSGEYQYPVSVNNLNFYTNIVNCNDHFIGLRMPHSGLFNTKEQNHLIIILDKNYNSIGNYFPVAIENNAILVTSFISSTHGQSASFIPFMSDTLFSVSRSGVQARYYLNFGKYQLTSEIRDLIGGDIKQAERMLSLYNSDEYATCRSILENMKYILFRVRFSKPESDRYFLYNKENKNQYALSTEIGLPVGVTKDNAFLFSINPNDTQPPILNNRLSSITNNSSDFFNLALVKYYFQ